MYGPCGVSAAAAAVARRRAFSASRGVLVGPSLAANDLPAAGSLGDAAAVVKPAGVVARKGRAAAS